MTELANPIPVVTPCGDGYAILVKDGGLHQNDLWTVVLKDGGRIMHFTSDQIRVHCNATFGIAKDASFANTERSGDSSAAANSSQTKDAKP